MRIVLAILLIANLLMADHDDDKKALQIPYDMSYLDLTRIQKQTIYRLLLSYRERRKTLHKKREMLERHTLWLFMQETFDKESFLRQHLQLRRELIEIEADFLTNLHTVLSEKQRKKFAHHLEEWEID